MSKHLTTNIQRLTLAMLYRPSVGQVSMNDLVRALAISAGILLAVVVLIVIITIGVVRRGEAAVRGTTDDAPADLPPPKEPAPSAKTAKPAAAPAAAGEEFSLATVLLLSIALFTLTMLLLFALSLILHMR